MPTVETYGPLFAGELIINKPPLEPTTEPGKLESSPLHSGSHSVHRAAGYKQPSSAVPISSPVATTLDPTSGLGVSQAPVTTEAAPRGPGIQGGGLGAWVLGRVVGFYT